jgi:hypothetical protein
MKKKDISDKIVFLTNTLGCFVLAFYFISLENISGQILGIYCILNILCFFAVVSHYGTEREVSQNELKQLIKQNKGNDKK